jgi:four helix bundle protein
MREFYFEKLDVWQNSREFIKNIYLITNHFPESEKFGITNQIRRASTSIAANIAEGISRNTNKDKAKFINQAFSSSIEVLNFIIISYDLELVEKPEYENLREKIEKITNQLNALHNKLVNA